MTDRNWTAEAVCARTDQEAWFPEVGGSPRVAKAICNTCPVIAPCLQWALTNKEKFGVWGGTTELERRSMKPAVITEVAA
jgi:WhiB family redox-sensing transcriptional regulator